MAGRRRPALAFVSLPRQTVSAASWSSSGDGGRRLSGTLVISSTDPSRTQSKVLYDNEMRRVVYEQRAFARRVIVWIRAVLPIGAFHSLKAGPRCAARSSIPRRLARCKEGSGCRDAKSAFHRKRWRRDQVPHRAKLFRPAMRARIAAEFSPPPAVNTKASMPLSDAASIPT